MSKQPTPADRHIELTIRLDRIEGELSRLVQLLDKERREEAGREAGAINLLWCTPRHSNQ